MNKQILYYFLATAGIALLLYSIFITTNPDNLPSAVFISIFCFIYLFIFCLLSFIGLAAANLKLLSWTTKRIQKTAALTSVFPVFLLVLQSIGQLTVRDGLLAVGLFVLLYTYFNRVAPSVQSN